MMMALSLAVLLLLLAGTLAREDLGGKVFLFPKQTSTAHVILHPEVKQPLQQVSVCLRSYTELGRNHPLFSLATQKADNAFLIYPAPPDLCAMYINQQQHIIKTDPETLSWKHTCVTWDSTTGVIQLWVNGKPYPRGVISKGFILEANTCIVLGQEQNSCGGGFYDTNSFIGEISDVHMWDYVLTPEHIRKVMYGDHQGNLLNWNSLTYEMKGEVLLEPKLQ